MDNLPVINRAYELYRQIVSINDQLGKRHRYSLGQSLEGSVLDLLGELIMAKNAPKTQKAIYLIRASSHTEITTLKLRLLLELGLANETKIFQSQARLTEIGKMLGGWLKSLSST